VGYVVSSETSLELILGDSLNIGVGVVVGLPPVCCGPEQLLCCEQDLLTLGAMCYLKLLLNRLQLVLYIHGILGLRDGVGAGTQKFTQPRLRWWGCLLLLQVRLQMLKSL
jgi:hypothetical protein